MYIFMVSVLHLCLYCMVDTKKKKGKDIFYASLLRAKQYSSLITDGTGQYKKNDVTFLTYLIDNSLLKDAELINNICCKAHAASSALFSTA